MGINLTNFDAILSFLSIPYNKGSIDSTFSYDPLFSQTQSFHPSDILHYFSLINSIPKDEQRTFFRQVSPLLSKEMSLSDKNKIINSFKVIPIENREFIAQLDGLITDTMSVNEKISILTELKNFRLSKLKAIANQVNNLLFNSVFGSSQKGFPKDSDRTRLVSELAILPTECIKDIDEQIKPLLSSNMSFTDGIFIVKELHTLLKNIREDVRDTVIDQILPLISNDMSAKDKMHLISKLHHYLPKNPELLIQGVHLISHTMSAQDRVLIINKLSLVPRENLESVITQALRLISDNMSGQERVLIIDKLNLIPRENLESVITQTLRLISDNMSGQERVLIIDKLNLIPRENLESVITQTLRLISDTMSGQDIISIFDRLNSLRIVDMASVVNQVVSRLSVSTSSQEIVRIISEESRNVDFREVGDIFSRINLTSKTTKFITSSDELNQDPIKVSLDLFEMLSNNSTLLLPSSIRYTDSDGIDAGGIKRSFVSQLIQSFCNPKYCLVKKTDLGAIPIIRNNDVSSLSLEEKEKCLLLIGRFFSAALQKHEFIQIGQYFHDIVFEMIFNLNEDDLVNKNTPQVFDKMLKIYMEKELHCKEDIVRSFLENNITEELRDIYCISSKEEFIESLELNHKINAVLLIANSMYNCLSDKNDWNRLKGDSATILRNNIQGVISKDIVINSFKSDSYPRSFEHIKRWIKESEAEHLQKFVEAISSMTTLPVNHNLHIEKSHGLDRLPIFHTCGFTIELSDYSSYDTFKEKLELSLAYCFEGGGYQIA